MLSAFFSCHRSYALRGAQIYVPLHCAISLPIHVFNHPFNLGCVPGTTSGTDDEETTPVLKEPCLVKKTVT